MGGKNSLICYILEQDLIQDALENNKKTMYFKLMLPNIRNKLKEAICVSRTPKQFVHTAMHVCEQISPDTKEAMPS